MTQTEDFFRLLRLKFRLMCEHDVGRKGRIEGREKEQRKRASDLRAFVLEGGEGRAEQCSTMIGRTIAQSLCSAPW